MRISQRLTVAAIALIATTAHAADYNCESHLSSGTSCSMTIGHCLCATSTTDASFGAVTASTATALAANGANCSAGQAPLGVDASGAVEGCFTPTAAAAGTDGQIQYNNGGSALGGADYRYDDGETQFESDTDWEIQIDDNANGTNSLILYDGAGTALATLTETGDSTLWDNGGGDLIFGGTANANNNFRTNTSDAADSEAICINGGGAVNDLTRGGHICAFGNEGTSGFTPGLIEIDAGNVAGGGIVMQIAGTTQAYLDMEGDFEVVERIAATGTAPTISSNCSINSSSTSIAGHFTLTGTTTSCTVTFAESWESAPSCVCNNRSGTAGNTYVSATSTSAFTCTFPSDANDVINYICIGYQT